MLQYNQKIFYILRYLKKEYMMKKLFSLLVMSSLLIPLHGNGSAINPQDFQKKISDIKKQQELGNQKFLDYKKNKDPKLNPTIPIYLSFDDVQLFTEFYTQYGLLVNPELNVMEDALYTVQFKTPLEPLDLFQQSTKNYLEQTKTILENYFQQQGSLDLYKDPKLTDTFFQTGNGSTHIYNALFYSFNQKGLAAGKTYVFAAKIPYFAGFPGVFGTVNGAPGGFFPFNNIRFQGYSNPADVTTNLQPNEILIELITSPNNPTGVCQAPDPAFDGIRQAIVADFVYSSTCYGPIGTGGCVASNLAWLATYRDQVPVYSYNTSSKPFGRSGDRCGFIWNDPADLVTNLNIFLWLAITSQGNSISGANHLLNLVQELLKRPDQADALHNDFFNTIAKRHQLCATELQARYPGTTISSIPGSPCLFASLPAALIGTTPAFQFIFNDVNTGTQDGALFGEPSNPDTFFRVSLSGASEIFAEFLNRLAGFDKYTVNDVFMSSAHECPCVTVDAEKCCGNAYVVVPGNCKVLVNASHGSVKITLPPFTNYISSQVITIKRIDNSKHKVTVTSDAFSTKLDDNKGCIKVQWTQPFYLNGTWKIVS